MRREERGGSFKPLTPVTLIGLRGSVVMMPGGERVEGVIVNETEKMIWIRGIGGAIKKIPKDLALITITTPSGQRISARGMNLIGRPEEMVKKRRRLWAKR